MKKFFLLIVGMVMALGVQAQGQFALAEGDTYKSGDQVTSVPNITLTFGEAGGADFQAAKADTQVAGYTAFTPGNGTNGNKAGGTFYTFTPQVDGTVIVAVQLNSGKKFYIEEDGTALADYNGITVDEKFYGVYLFDVKAGKSYKVYCAGSKLGFYGFEFIQAQPEYNLNQIVDEYMALHSGDSEYTFELEAGAKYILSAPIVTDRSLTITSDKTNPAVIFASDNTSNAFILMSTKPAVQMINSFYRVDNITLKHLKIYGVTNSLFYDNNTKYCVVDFTIDDCFVDMPTGSVQNEALISFKAGGINDLTIKRSTFYGNNQGAKYFIRYNNNGRVDRYGLSTWSMTYDHNTFYGLLKSDGQWGNYGGVAGKAGLMTLTINNNIWYDCDAQTMRRLTHSKNFSNFNKASTMANNTFWYQGAAKDQGNYGNGTDLTTEPLFADAAAGDFTLAEECDQYKNLTGDPRWLKNYVEGVAELELKDGAVLNEAVDSVYKKMNPEAIKIYLKKLGKYKVTGSLFVNCPLTISGADGVEIDAAECNAPFILMRPIPEIGQNDFGAYEISELTLKDIKINNLKNRLFYADRQNYLFGKVSLENCFINVDGTTPRTLIDFYCGGNTKELTIKNSTLSADPANSLRGGLFNTQGSKGVAEMCGEYGQTITIANSTLYNIAKGMTPVLLDRHSQEGLTFVLNDNIFVNCGEKGNLLAGMNEGVYNEKNFEVEGNAYTYDGEDTSADEKLDTDAVAGVVIFEDAAAKNFTPLVVTEAYENKLGDPRWLMDVPATSAVIEAASGSDLSTAIAEATAGKTINNILVKLAANGNYTTSKSIVVGGNLKITVADGDAEGQPVIDASALEGPFIQLAEIAAPAAAARRATNEKGFTLIDKIEFTGAKITGLKYQFFYANKQKYLVKELSVNDGNINIDGTNKKTIFDFNGGGLVESLNVIASTLWANPSNAQNGGFYSTQSGSKIDEAGASKNDITIAMSTLYNIASGKTTSSLRQNSQTAQKYIVKGNVIADCGKEGQFLAGLNGGQKGKATNWEIDNNNFTFGGKDVSSTEASKIAGNIGTVVVDTMSFVDPANGDFTLLSRSAQNIARIGALSWWNIAPKDTTVVVPSGTDLGAYVENLGVAMALELDFIDKLTLTLEKDGQYTSSKPMYTMGGIELKGNGATLDASAMTDAFITTPTAETSTWENIGTIYVENLDVTGLKTPLFASKTKNYIYDEVAFNNVGAELAADVTTIDFTKGSTSKIIGMAECTFYAPTATTKSFYSSQGGQKVTEADEENIQIFALLNNTMYNLAKGKNFFSHRSSNQKWMLYDVKNNLFVNCGKSGQVIRGLNGGQGGKNPTWLIYDNAFNFDGEDTGAKESTGDSTEGEEVSGTVAGVVTFKDAAGGDFNGTFALAEGAEVPESLGANRWLIEFTTPTGINAVKTAEETELENATIYNLNGQRVQSAKKGLYIVNGRKVVVK